EALLAALPDLWAERFYQIDAPTVASAMTASDDFASALTSLAWLQLTTQSILPKWLAARAGLDKPERGVTVERESGDKGSVLIGSLSSTRSKRVMRPSPPGVPAPPQEQFVTEEYRYAKLQDNEQVFEIKAEPLKDVFVSLDTLREPRLARFTSGEVKNLQIQ